MPSLIDLPVHTSSRLHLLRSRTRSLFAAEGPLSTTRFLLLVVGGALLLRLLVVVSVTWGAACLVRANTLGWESWEMGWTARSLFLGHGFSSPFLAETGPTALMPPLFPLLLAGLFKLFGLNTLRSAVAMLTINSVCGSLTCVPLYLLLRDALNERAARIAAVGWAVYPLGIYFAAARLWDYALTSLLLTCCLLLAHHLPGGNKGRGKAAWIGFGVLFGLVGMSNPSALTLLPGLLLLALLKVRRRGRPWLGAGLLAGLAFLLVSAPWAVRNQVAMHTWVPFRDGFWLEFYAGNSGDGADSNSKAAHPASNPVEMTRYQQLGEIGYIAEKRVLALGFVEQHPLLFAVSSARRVVRFWTGFWSFSREYLSREPLDVFNVPFCLFLLYGMVRGLTRWWRLDRAGVLPYLAAVLLFPLPYYLTHSSMDYRQPIEPVLVALVTVGLFGATARQDGAQEV